MGARKIVDEGEVLRWFDEGRTYEWMSAEYLRKYNIVMSPSSWGNFRNRRGLDLRSVRNSELIPWAVKEEHRWNTTVRSLRAEARIRDGQEIPKAEQARLDSFHAKLAGDNELGVPLVVHYDPDYVDGFVLIPREEEDDDIIRRPRRVTTPRRSRVAPAPHKRPGRSASKQRS